MNSVKASASLVGAPNPGYALSTTGVSFSPEERSDVETELTASRNRALLSFATEAVQELDAEPLIALQSILQHGDVLGRWETSQRWMPIAQQSLRDVDLRRRTIDFLPAAQQAALAADDKALQILSASVSDESAVSVLLGVSTKAQRLVSEAVLAMVRYLILCRMGPAGIGKKAKGRSLDPSTIARTAYQQLPQLMAMGLSKRLGVEDEDAGFAGFFQLIVESDFAELRTNDRQMLERELKRMHMLRDRGLWSDVAVANNESSTVTPVAGEAEVPKPESAVDPHLPLPDDYVAEMGRKSFWLINELAPSLLQVTAQIREIWLRPDNRTVSAERVAQRRDEALREVLSRHSWVNEKGTAICPPPFRLSHGRDGKEGLEETIAADPSPVRERAERSDTYWHPRFLVDISFMLKLVQMAHFFVVGLSMGARRSELTTLNRDCVQHARNGMPYASGRTWKLVERHDGASREWVLPDLAMQAVEQQSRLVKLIDDIGTRAPRREAQEAPSVRTAGVHLWAQLGGGQADRTLPLTNTRASLRAFAIALGMDPDPGGQGVRVHRFRKTIARLAALALDQAPKILMDVFGHKSIEMTIYYILTDKDLQIDVERVTRELRVMRAKETVEAMVLSEEQSGLPTLGGFGGPAAPVVSTAISVQRDRLYRRGEDWGAGSAYELAEILTLQGKAWQLVRPGVVCTKFPGTESGPCNKSKGAPEPSRCQSHCKHRLEEAMLRSDVDDSISEALRAYKTAEESADDLLLALWADQVRLHFGRFPDFRLKWMEDATVRTILETTGEEELA